MNYSVTKRNKLPRNKYGDTALNTVSGVYGRALSGGSTITNNQSSYTTNVTNKIYNTYTTTLYNINTFGVKTNTGYTYLYTHVDNYNTVLLDQNTYRFVLCRYRRNNGTGRKWRVPMFSYLYNGNGSYNTAYVTYGAYTSTEDGHSYSYMNKITYTEVSAMDWNNTYWPVQARTTKWFNKTGDEIRNVCSTEVKTVKGRKVFKNNKNIKQKFGCALYSKSNNGWQRISNISEVDLYLTTNGRIMVEGVPEL